MRRVLLLLGVGGLLGASGAGAATLVTLPEQASPHAEEAVGAALAGGGGSAQDDGGVHGGPIERFQEGSCDLASGLAGNWTHGDYVSAVAEGGNSALIMESATSDCGKPMVAVGRGGPPEHALEHAARGLETASGHAEAGLATAAESVPGDVSPGGPPGS